MLKPLIVGFVSFAGLSLVSCGSDSPTDPSGTDLIGSWTCSKTSDVVSGPCLPAHVAESGTCTFTKYGSGAALRFSDGFACSPAAACTLSCTGTGTASACQNQGVADQQGGQYSSQLAIALTSNNQATGAGTSTYTLGIQCQWQVLLNLSRR
jgi:hypothetical protein